MELIKLKYSIRHFFFKLYAFNIFNIFNSLKRTQELVLKKMQFIRVKIRGIYLSVMEL